MKRRTLFWLLTFSFVVFLGAVVVWADRGAMPRPITLLYAFPAGDKVGHLVLMGILAALMNLSLAARRVSMGGRRLLLGSLLVAAAITIEEASQLLFRNRTFSLIDLGMGYLGVYLSRYPASWIWLSRPSPEQRSLPSLRWPR